MKHETIIAVAFALAGATLWAEDAKDAVPIDGSYCIVVPSEGQGGVVKALKQAGKELADAFRRGGGGEGGAAAGRSQGLRERDR